MEFNCVKFVLASSAYTDTVNVVKETIVHLLLSDLTKPNSMGEYVGLGKCEGYYDWADAKILLDHATEMVTLHGNSLHLVRINDSEFHIGFAGKYNLKGLKNLLEYILKNDVHYDLASCTKDDPILFSHGKFLDHTVMNREYKGEFDHPKIPEEVQSE